MCACASVCLGMAVCLQWRHCPLPICLLGSCDLGAVLVAAARLERSHATYVYLFCSAASAGARDGLLSLAGLLRCRVRQLLVGAVEYAAVVGSEDEQFSKALVGLGELLFVRACRGLACLHSRSVCWTPSNACVLATLWVSRALFARRPRQSGAPLGCHTCLLQPI